MPCVQDLSRDRRSVRSAVLSRDHHSHCDLRFTAGEESGEPAYKLGAATGAAGFSSEGRPGDASELGGTEFDRAFESGQNLGRSLHGELGVCSKQGFGSDCERRFSYAFDLLTLTGTILRRESEGPQRSRQFAGFEAAGRMRHEAIAGIRKSGVDAHRRGRRG